MGPSSSSRQSSPRFPAFVVDSTVTGFTTRSLKVSMTPVIYLALCVGLLASAAFGCADVGNSHSERRVDDHDERNLGGPHAQIRGSDCTADELLPSLEEDLQYRWMPIGEGETRPLVYNCTCRFTKARYNTQPSAARTMCDNIYIASECFYMNFSVFGVVWIIWVATKPPNVICPKQIG